MDSIITFFCIVGLCISMYGYIRMTQINNDYPVKCNTIYIPMDDSIGIGKNMDVLDHREHDRVFSHMKKDKAPMGKSDIEYLIQSSLI